MGSPKPAHGQYTSAQHFSQHPLGWPGSSSQRAYIDLAILKALLQVVVDCLIGDLADKGEIRNSDFFLLGRLEGRLLDLRLSTGSPGLRGGSILLSSSSFGDGLGAVRSVNWRNLTVLAIEGSP
jgi:hypothetical protein